MRAPPAFVPSCPHSRAVRSMVPATPRASTPPMRRWGGTTSPARCCRLAATSTSPFTVTAGLPCRAPDGKEAYTRAGDLQVDANGQLTTGTGHPVLGDGGPITVPPYTSIYFARDGSISIVAQGQTPDTTSTVERIKLVKPADEALARGDDGLFRMKDGSSAPSDPSVQLGSGTLESSNVNTADAMVTMIELARHFEMQVKAIRTAEENGAAAARIMRLGG